jgi:ArsR family transcriptional regulator, virulence genes transcriptional regulator
MKINYDIECEMCKIFSNSNRMRILIALKKNPKTVSQLMEITELPQSVISQHLSMMRSKGILKTERKGSFTEYKLKYPKVMRAFNMMREITKKTRRR